MKKLPVLLILLLPAVLRAQEDLLTEDAGSAITESESNTSSLELLAEQYEQLRLNPLNLNTATAAELTGSGLFTPFQVFSLLEYRDKYGPFFTTGELAALPGFREEDLLPLLPCLTLSSNLPDNSRKKTVLRGELILTSGIKSPLPAGFLPQGTDSLPAFRGSPVKFSLRLRGQAGAHWDWGAVAEKDPGETLLYRFRPQFGTAFLRYRGKTFLKEAVGGSYRIKTGLGLVNGLATGQGNAFTLNGFRAGEIRPYASVNENNFNTGLALRAGSGKWETIGWTSFRHRDLSPGSAEWNRESPDLFRVLDETGLKRTTGEETGRGLISLRSSGIQLSRRSAHLTTALTLQSGRAGLRAGSDTLTGFSDTLVTRYSAVSLFGLWFNDRFTLFAEAALSGEWSAAVLGGLSCRATSFMDFTLTGRYFSPAYFMPDAEAWSLGSSVSNEAGIYAGLRIFPVKYTTVELLSDQAFFREERYLCSLPSGGSRQMTEIRIEPPGGSLLRFRYTEKRSESTPADGLPGVDPVIGMVKRDIRLDGKVALNGNLELSYRLEGLFLSSLADEGPAQLAFLQFRWTGENYRFVLRHTLFSIPEWEQRITCYEPGLRNSYGFSTFYGRGNKTLLSGQWKPLPHLSVALKLSLLSYRDRLESGSGDDLVAGDKRWEAEFQLILK
ncbi:MAG: hypothetical protein ACOYXB_13155 [Bacteroidota bacterium]